MQMLEAPRGRRRVLVVVYALSGLAILGGVMGLLANLTDSGQSPTTDPRSQATIGTGQAVISTRLAGGSSQQVGSPVIVEILLNGGGVPLSGVQAGLTVEGPSRPNAVTWTLASPQISQGYLNVSAPNATSQKIVWIGLPQSATTPLIVNSDQVIAQLRFTPATAGVHQVKFIPEMSFAYQAGTNPPTEVMRVGGQLDINITSHTPTPTIRPSTTPTPSVTISPSMAPSPTVRPTASPTPTVSTSPTPTPSDGATAPRLQFSVTQQGVSQANKTVEGVLTIQKPTGSPIQVPVTLKSRTGGVLAPESPAILRGLGLTQATSVTVALKTTVSLNKRLGNVTLTPQNTTTAPASWQDAPLLVGDFVRSGTMANLISIIDVAALLSEYTGLSVPVTNDNREYDVNFDNQISIQDVALVLTNYTQLEVRGD